MKKYMIDFRELSKQEEILKSAGNIIALNILENMLNIVTSNDSSNSSNLTTSLSENTLKKIKILIPLETETTKTQQLNS